MSAGDFSSSIYESNTGDFYPIRIQPETLTLTLNSVANAAGAGPLGTNIPSAKVSGGRTSFGVNARLVRVRFTSTIPDGYSGGKDTISLPVLTPAAFTAYDKGQTGTYTLGGTAYDVAFVGKTPEAIN